MANIGSVMGIDDCFGSLNDEIFIRYVVEVIRFAFEER